MAKQLWGVTYYDKVMKCRGLVSSSSDWLFDTKAEAQQRLGYMILNNDPKRLERLFGEIELIEATLVDCWLNRQPKGVWFD